MPAAISKKPSLSVVPDSAERMLALFGGARCNGHGPEMLPPNAEGKVLPVEVHKWTKRPTAALWRQHLAGTLCLGVIPPNASGSVSFGVADVDDYGVNAVGVAAKIDAMKLPLVPCLSKSGGVHAYLFASEPVDPELMRRALVVLAGRLGIRPTDADIIVTANVWMPYSGGDGAARCCIKKTGAHATLAEFLEIAEAARQTPDQIAALAAAPAPRQRTSEAATDDPGGPARAERELARHCEEVGAMADGEGRNKRLNVALFAMGSMVGAGWITEGRVADALRAAARRAGMDKAKVDAMIRRTNGPLAKGEKEPPPADGEYPRVLRVRKHLTDPVSYTVDIEGGTLERLTSTDLLKYENFNRVCYERLNLRFLEMKRDTWNRALRAVPVEDVEASPEFGDDARFRELVDEYLSNRNRGDSIEDLFGGRPFLDMEEKLHFFRLPSLEKFILRDGGDRKLVERGREWMAAELRKMGARSNKVMKIKGRALRSWSLPQDALEPMPELPVPAMPDPGI